MNLMEKVQSTSIVTNAKLVSDNGTGDYTVDLVQMLIDLKTLGQVLMEKTYSTK